LFNKKTFTLILCLLSFLCSISAQEEAVRFRHLSYREGLFQSPVVTMLQDRSGYVWVGNWSGLSRYDGTSFKLFRQNDNNAYSISHNRINKLLEDSEGRLWIATSGGLNLYDEKTQKFSHIGISTAKGGGNYIANLFQDSYGTIWVSTFSGLKFINSGKDTLFNVPVWKARGELELFNGVSFCLFQDDKKIMWTGIKQGLKCFDPKSKKVVPLPEAVRSNQILLSAKVLVIKQDRDGNMWFGTEEDGLFCYDRKRNVCKRYAQAASGKAGLPSNSVNDILIREDRIWVATRDGLSVYNPERDSFSTYKHDSAISKSISDDSVWSLMTDRTGNIWVGTYSGGINIYYAANSNFLNIGERIGNGIGLNKPLANAIVEDHADGLWVGTFGGGLNYVNRSTGQVKYYPVLDESKAKLSNEIKAMVDDGKGNLWMGTLDGFCKFDKNSGSLKYFDLRIINNKTGAKLVNSIVKDQNGFWVGTNGGGLRFVDFTGRETRSFIKDAEKNDGLGDNYINTLLLDEDFLWIGTQNGLNVYHKTTGKFALFRRHNKIGLGNNNVLCLFRDSGGRLWIGTDGGGLDCMDLSSKKIYNIREENGLCNNVVSAMSEDKDGNLWVSTNNGISKIRVVKGSFPDKKGDYAISSYNAANGLPGNQFLINSVLVSTKGELLFGGMNGITTFFPDRIVKNNIKPALLMTDILVNNKKLLFGEDSVMRFPFNNTSELKLNHDQNNITVKFSALNFVNPEKNQYAYKMSGLTKDGDWIFLANQREVNFPNLSPGRYTFTVKAANNDGVWNPTGRSFTLIVSPPFYATWWAILVYFLFTTIIVAKVFQFLRIRAKLEKDLFNEHLETAHQKEFYRLKMEFFTNISHELRTPLTLILGPVENLKDKLQNDPFLDRQVSQIKKNADRLLRLIGELMDFRKAETGNMVLRKQHRSFLPFLNEVYLSFQPLAEEREVAYTLQTIQKEVIVDADLEQLEKVFFNFLSNAFKFTPAQGKIEISADVDPDRKTLTIKISDSGKGIPKEFHEQLFSSFYQVEPDLVNPGTGVGLALAKNIIELHQGKVLVESNPGIPGAEGFISRFTISLPIVVEMKDVSQLSLEPLLVIDQENSKGNNAEYEPISETEKALILVVEDNDELRNFIVESISRYDVMAKANGADGFLAATEHIPDLIISDVMMPVMDGLELCRKIKSDERTSHIPVILLTALSTHLHQVNGLQKGADAYLTKPFSIEILKLNIKNLLFSRAAMRTKFSQEILLQPKGVAITSMDEVFIAKLLKLIDDNIENPEFGVNTLGEKIGMSKTVLYKKICALTDMNPSDFLKSMRLKKAAMLITDSDLNVNEISAMVGFNDRKYFSREFKKQFACTPIEMIAAQRNRTTEKIIS
jgi:ligand-binding sensor domain-containing protein/signal transduction histidine kinase/AraC-like DNA-binding protein